MASEGGSFFWTSAAGIAAVVAMAWAIPTFFADRRKEQATEEEENQLQRDENYIELTKLWMENQNNVMTYPEIDKHDEPPTDPNTITRQRIYYEKTMAILEIAFMLFHKPDDKSYDEIWHSWDDYLMEMLEKNNFREQFEELLKGENIRFQEYFRAKKETLYPHNPDSPEPRV
jgi:hypothetical protein